MNGLVAACGLILLALVLPLVLKKDAPDIAFLLTLTAGVLILLVIALAFIFDRNGRKGFDTKTI